ncbi:MAG: DUF819 family protein [Deltaproteobacteria bacterium]|nr:DUF819 family protein [Deltaproteobacteria bacterium]
METLVPAAETPLLLAILAACAAGALWAEERFAFARKVTAFMVALLAGMALSNARVIPSDAPALDLVWAWVVPLALPLLLVRANLVRIFRETGPTLGAFLVGAVGTVLGGFLAAWLVPVGPESWKATGVFVGTYVGGSINFLAIARATDLSPGIASAAIAADNLVMTVYFFVLIAAARSARLHRWFARDRGDGIARPGEPEQPRAEVRGSEAKAKAPLATVGGPAPARPGESHPPQAEPRGTETQRPPATVVGLATSLAFAFGAVAVGTLLARVAGTPHLTALFITALAVALATAIPGRLATLAGAEELGVFLMHVFAVALGAAADVRTIVERGPLLFAMAATIIAVHMLFMLGVCRALRLPLAESIIASNANIGGPTTASAFAVAVHWERLVLPAVLAGVLGYVIANYIGLGVAWAVR